MPREVQINDHSVLTGIYKEPVTGPVWLGHLTLAGDGQADLTVHGGQFQAAYTYPMEHYAHWEKVLGKNNLPPGTFGENFTTSGLLENEICVGDVLRIGEAHVQVTMPRLPCFKFAHKVGHPAILKEFLHSGYSGFYHSVLQEGFVKAGDEIELLKRDPNGITIRQILGMQKLGEGDAALLNRALEMPSLPPLLRRDLQLRRASI